MSEYFKSELGWIDKQMNVWTGWSVQEGMSWTGKCECGYVWEGDNSKNK